MKKNLLLTCLLFPLLTLAQSNPMPQALPYQQDFSALPHTATAFPDGWMGWVLSGAPSGNFNVLPATADKALAANSSASSTTNGVLNYNGKAGFLNSGTVDNALALSLNTTGNTGVNVLFRVMTIRNPYDSAANTRINEVALQYRVGESGNFTTLTTTAYQNNNIRQTGSGVTTPQNPALRQVLLPAECENKPVVQLRWVNRQISGGGSRPGFAIDSVVVTGVSGDVTPPVIDSLLPANGTAGVQPGAIIQIAFNENIRKNAGTLVIHNLTHGTQQILDINSSAITVSGSILSIQAGLRGNRTYFVTLDSNAVQDSNGNGFAGIADSTVWKFSTGSQLLDFDFSDCISNLSGGFTQYNVSGAQVWACTTFGQTGRGVQINGFSGGAARENEDWLISPVLDLSGFNYPLLSFSGRSAFNGPALELKISTDYRGSGDPRLATWTAINGRFPETASDVWSTSSGINLAAFKGTDVYIAWVYTSSPGLQASRWTLDDIHITNSTTAPPPTITTAPAMLDFDYVRIGQHSDPQPFTFWANDLTAPLNVTAPSNFEISLDKAQYFPTLTFPATEGQRTVWARFSPAAADQNFSGPVSFASAGLAAARVQLSGTSLRTLKVMNWNMEWFGSRDFGPADDNLQQTNALKVLRSAGADIYALCEVVDTLRLKTIVDSLPGYRYTISDFGSRADSITAPDYNGAQKLAFVYKDSLIKNIRTYGVLRQGGSTTARYNWSSGRFPYLMETSVVLNNDTARIHFIVIHAKANTGTAAEKIESWHRRKNGAKELKDSLDTQYPYNNLLVLGDFNDDFNRTITTELAPDTTTSYIDFRMDTLDYTPFTYPLSLAKQRSTVSFSSMIDQVMGSNEMQYAYIPQSTKVLRYVETLIPSYSTTTSDHYPVISRYDIRVLAHPVVITTFTAREQNGGVGLSWSTTREINNDRFIVERSANQRNFIPIDTVPSTAVNGQGAAYTSQDNSVLPGYWHYRLKQIGKDSSFRYSPVQSVLVLSRQAWFRLFWYILGSRLHIYLEAPERAPASIQLIDMQGMIRYNGQTDFFKGSNYKSVDVGHLPAGIYLLKVQCGSKTEVKKIFISR